MGVRRVVTGHVEGRSTFVDDATVEAMALGAGGDAWMVWGRDNTASYPDDGSQPTTTALFPPVGGCRMTVIRLAAGQCQAFDQFVVDGLPEFADPAEPGMHRTATIDFDVVVSGSVVLQLDDGEVELHPGDVVVQNGTRHRWENRGTEDVILATTIVGAEHSVEGGSAP